MLFDITFDLDGVLADTFEANRLAYASVGITMPRVAWGRPWQTWLLDEEAHAAKQGVYLGFLMDHLHSLAGVAVARHIVETGAHVGVITNASLRSASQVLGLLDLEVSGLLCENKIMHLAQTRPYCHVDDQFVSTDVPIVPYVNDEAQLLKAVEAYL